MIIRELAGTGYRIELLAARDCIMLSYMKKKIAAEAKVLMDYDRWVTKHLDEMVRKYPGKVIAVYRGKLVAVGDSYKEVFSAARAQGITEQPFAMEVPRPEEFEAILLNRRPRSQR